MERRAFMIGMSSAVLSMLLGQTADAEETGSVTLPYPLVDTHVHFWDPDHLQYSWIESSEILHRPYLPADHAAAMKPYAVERIVFVQAACAREQALDEAIWVSELAKDEPRIGAIVADAPLEDGDAVRPFLESLKAYPLVRGIRRLIQGETDPEFCTRPDFVRGVQLLAEYDYSFDLGVRRDQLGAVTALVDACPNVRFIVDHCANPAIREGEMEPWKRDLAALAERPHVWCKLSGITTAADRDSWTAEELRPYVEHVLEVFGFDRTAYGSDWPVMLLACPLVRWYETVAALVAQCSLEERTRLFGTTGSGFYRL